LESKGINQGITGPRIVGTTSLGTTNPDIGRIIIHETILKEIKEIKNDPREDIERREDQRSKSLRHKESRQHEIIAEIRY